jgi:hypothetical protein
VQLDKTCIAIRERGLLETLDLSLHVMRRWGVPLLATFACGALPLAMINHALVGWMMRVDSNDAWLYLEEGDRVVRFLWAMTVLVVLEAPLASVLTTAYLGKVVFVDRPRVSEVWWDVVRMSPRVAWCQLLLRGVLPAWFLMMSLDREGDAQPVIEVLLLGGLLGLGLLLRAVRPYVNEIVLLERSPLTAKTSATITVGRRSQQLHGPSSGDLLARAMGSAVFAILLTAAVMGFFLFVSGVFLNDWTPGSFMLTCCFPLSLWLVACYFTVVRFLNYLDLRIRHEGWEVELRLRAEAARITGSLT